MTGALLHWEDYPVGETVKLGSRTVTKAQILAFANAYDPQPFHIDEEAAKDTLLGGLAASGWHSCAVMMQLMCEGYLLKSASLGAPGIEEVRWLKPVRPDDTLTLVRTTLDRRPSKSNPAMGLTQFKLEVFNQHGEPVLRGRYWQLFGRRGG